MTVVMITALNPASVLSRDHAPLSEERGRVMSSIAEARSATRRRKLEKVHRPVPTLQCVVYRRSMRTRQTSGPSASYVHAN